MNNIKIPNKMSELYSFDIFDTLITRNTATPFGIFYLMEHRIKNDSKFYDLPKFLVENFFRIRTQSEYFSQKNQLKLNKKLETTIDSIYQIIEENYNLSKEQIRNLKDLEISIEKSNFIGISENIQIVKKYLSQKKMVILISDMYYSSDTLKEFLIKTDKIFENIKIYVSSDLGETKRNASIYTLIKKDFPNIKKWTHLGDNYFSDVICAKWCGINSKKYDYIELLPYEKYLLKKFPQNYKFELITGCAKNLRLNKLEKNEKYIFGASFSAPILYNYTSWVIEQSLNRNIKHLYFVSRDGFIPKIIADLIIKEKNLDIQTHYFYSSRAASRVVDDENYNQYIEWIFSELKSMLSSEFILKRLNTSVDEFSKTLNISRKEIKSVAKLKKLLFSNEAKDLILKKNLCKKNLFIKYLKQEIDFSKQNFAFVDLNGSGRTQDNLAQQIKPFFKGTVVSFYLHNQSDMEQKENSIKCSYINTTQYISAWIELLCRTVDGQTLGYKEENGKIVPIKEYEKNDHILNWGYNDYLNGIEDFTKAMIDIEKTNSISVNSLELYCTYFEFFTKHSDRKTAEIIGSIPFAIYGEEKMVKQTAPAYNLFNLFSNKTDFPFISISRSGKIIQTITKLKNKIFSKKTYGFISKEQKLAYIKIFNKKIDIRKFIWKNGE